jgi:hypothetical protein
MSLPVSDPGGRLPVHRLHDEEIERLLASGERKAELTALFGDKAYRELAALAKRADARRARGGPRVYVLPGLMGSRIGTRGRLLDDVLWLDPIEVAAGHLVRLALPRGARLVALGAMLLNALKLKLSLQIAGFDARFPRVRLATRRRGTRCGIERTDRSRRRARTCCWSGTAWAASWRACRARRRPRSHRAGRAARRAELRVVRARAGTARRVSDRTQAGGARPAARCGRFRTNHLPLAAVSLHELLPDPRLAPGPDLFDPAAWPDDALRPDRELLADAASARERWPGSGSTLPAHRRRAAGDCDPRRAEGHEFHYTIERNGDGTVPLVLAALPETLPTGTSRKSMAACRTTAR